MKASSFSEVILFDPARGARGVLVRGCWDIGWSTRVNGGKRVPGPESEILETFVAQLRGEESLPSGVADRLAELLAVEPLPKPQVLVDLYKAESGEALA